MEEKYCERCGVFLGLVNPCKKYCEECKIIVRRERQALIKKGIKAKPEPALCTSLSTKTIPPSSPAPGLHGRILFLES